MTRNMIYHNDFGWRPAGKRAVRNTGSTPLTMLCIQYQSATPGSVTPADGTILTEPVKW